jgi:hypothetical protein
MGRPPISKAATPAPKTVEPDPTWQHYTGKYRNAWGDSQVLVLNGELVMIGPTLPDPTLTVDKLVPVAEHTFRIETKNGFGSCGELVIFEMDDAGKVNHVKIGENYTYPQAEW